MYSVNKWASGQSAIEYLMTYGWMLLVVAVVGGAIFTTVGDQNVDSVTGFAGGDVVVEDYGVSNEEEIGLEVRSGTGDSVVVSKVNVSDPSTGEYVYKEFTGDTKVDVGSSKIFELPNVSRSSGANTLDIEIIYDTGSLSDLSVRGTVSGSIELTGSGSYKGDPENDHQSINDEEGLSLLQTVNYTYDDSGDVKVNETTAGADGYQVDLNNDFSKEVEEIKIVEMHGADGSKDDQTLYPGGSGGLITNASANVSSYNHINIWVGETSGDYTGGFGNATGGSGGESIYNSGGGGGSTELWLDDSNMVATVDAGGGAYNDYDSLQGGGGARGGLGHQNAEGSGEGGDGGTSSSGEGEDGGQELGIASLETDGNEQTGGSDSGSGWILLEYYG